MARRFFLTKHIPTTHIYRNHIDEIHGQLEDFCSSNRSFDWGVVLAQNGKVRNRNDIEKYFRNTMPEKVRYYVTSSNQGSLTIDIGDGLTVNIKSGSFALLGLFSSLDDIFKVFRVPFVISFLRKYWMINLSVFYIMLLVFIFVTNVGLSNLGWGALWILGLFGLAALFAYIYDKADDWSDIFPDTKIEFTKFNKHMGVSYVSLITSAKALVSFLAALATIVSTVYLVAGR